MRILRHSSDVCTFLDILKKRASGGNSEVEKATKSILGDVKKNGDKAVLKCTKKFDYSGIKALPISEIEITKYSSMADKKVVKAIEVSAKRIRKFHEMQKENSWLVKDAKYKKLAVSGAGNNIYFSKALLGQIIQPLERVGVYVPGGKASYPSTVLMNVIPAQVAGVKEIALCVPTPLGGINPYVMSAIKLLGINEVYRIGGAQAIAAMAYGTETIRKVDKIVGPGNIYVATAKKMVFGEVGIDMIAGPSEILIIADDSGDPEFIAADIVSQAEHDEFASSVLITTSNAIAEKVGKELIRQIEPLKRKAIVKKSLSNYGAIIIVKDINDALNISNDIAPEHLEIMTENPDNILPKIRNAGAVFLGRWTPEPLGDYSAGPNHTLPTGGTARFSSPLGVYDFIKRTSLLSFTEKGFREISNTVESLADAEGLEAHANTVRVRMKKS